MRVRRPNYPLLLLLLLLMMMRDCLCVALALSITIITRKHVITNNKNEVAIATVHDKLFIVV